MRTMGLVTVIALLLVTLIISGCVTQQIPVFVTGKIKTADGVCVTVVNDTAYTTSCNVFDQIRVNETNYVNFDATSIGIPGGTKISGVR